VPKGLKDHGMIVEPSCPVTDIENSVMQPRPHGTVFPLSPQVGHLVDQNAVLGGFGNQQVKLFVGKIILDAVVDSLALKLERFAELYDVVLGDCGRGKAGNAAFQKLTRLQQFKRTEIRLVHIQGNLLAGCDITSGPLAHVQIALDLKHDKRLSNE